MAKGSKTGGREAGTPNRLTKELRTTLKNILFEEFENLPSQLDKLKPKERIELMIKLLPFALPKTNTVNYRENEPSPYGLDLF